MRMWIKATRDVVWRQMRCLVLMALAGFFNFTAKGQIGKTLRQLVEKEAGFSGISSPGFVQEASSNGLNINVIHYGCQWFIDPANDSIKGKIAITFRAKESLSQTTLDLANNLHVEKALFRNQVVSTTFTNTSTLLVNLAPQSMAQGETDSLVIWYRGKPIPSLFGSYSRVLHENVPVIYTLSEPFCAKDWWPCKQVLNDKADSVDITIYTPAPNVAVSNGLLVGQSEANGVRTYHWKHKYPVATYLLALAVTNFEHFRLKAVLQTGDTLPIDNYCYPESKADWLTGMADVVDLMQDYDTTFGPYPFAKEKYGHCEFAFGGGMEHQTISFMQNTDYVLQAHELAHHWFGDKITCGSWKDIWLNEGFATYMASNQNVKRGATTWKQEAKAWIDFITSEPAGSVYCQDTTDLYRIFSGRLSYCKGAMLLRMLRFQVGDSAFWNGIRTYVSNQSLAYDFAKTNDFKLVMEQASGQNLTQFFNNWYMGEGFPTYQLHSVINGSMVHFTLSQTTSHPSVPFYEMKIPIQVKGNGFDSLLVVDHTVNNQSFSFQLPFLIDTLIFDPEHQILAKSEAGVISKTAPSLSKNTLHIAPNPATTWVSVSCGLQTPGKLILVNSLGQQVHQWSANAKMQVSVAGFPPGLYRLVLHAAEGVETIGLVVK